ncbi:hypothetical protein K7J14_03390 [Treponema zuelzerae]|uniref:Uncharacterized protein n=1 Tax=Teretinema zuelzerae TaxID=156 RepID=A0AAE3JI40_9SPIR|nr:hypothetical protein [Teretinema zuelzerae]MCD1653741.1 hypothetical protein [Teretinema zuelzerae]
MNIRFIIHESCEAPGACLNWADGRGHEARFVRVYHDERAERGRTARHGTRRKEQRALRLS